MACAGGMAWRKLLGVAYVREREGEGQGEKTEVAGVTGDRGSLSESESVAEDEVEDDRLRFIGVDMFVSIPAVASRSSISSLTRSKSLMCLLVSLAIAHGR